MTASAPREDLIIVGIDFGTTFSGAAWAYSGQPDDIEVVTDWETELNRCSDVEKAPTQISFGDKKEKTTWGFGVSAEKDALKWFKLLLLDEEDVSKDVAGSTQYQEARTLQGKLGKSAIEIIACFVGNLWNHTVDSIRSSIGAGLLEKCKFRVVITVPAIWTPKAHMRMRKAVEMSGILAERSCGATKLSLISEPEAAALATMKDFSKRSTIQRGDTLVVCDAGGGTVDLISYIVETVNPFVVKECVKGDGCLSGGVLLDEEFIKLIKEKVTKIAWESVSKKELRKFLNDEWEYAIKPQFGGQPRTWSVDLPQSCAAPKSSRGQAKGLKRSKTLDLELQDLLRVYWPIMQPIETLVQRQSEAVKMQQKKPPTYIVLVGGFGRSPYLLKCLERIREHSTTILQPRGSRPWTAICRGAVIRGLTSHDLSESLSVKVASRVARQSYGISLSRTWDQAIHLQQDKYWSEHAWKWKARNQMDWFLKQGDNMETKDPVRYFYRRHFKLTDSIENIDLDIQFSNIDPPPSRLDTFASILCTIKWNKPLEVASLPTWTNSLGKVYYVLDFEVVMTCDEGVADFTIYHENQRVGNEDIAVQFQ